MIERRFDALAFISCLVGDLDETRASACAERLRAMGAPATAFPGAAEATMDQVLKAIPKGALCLAYLDPYNLPPMATPNCSTYGRSNCSRQDGRMVTIRAWR